MLLIWLNITKLRPIWPLQGKTLHKIQTEEEMFRKQEDLIFPPIFLP